MSEIALIAQAIASLQSAGQLAKALIGSRDQTMIDVKVIELRDNLIEAQSNVFQAQAQQTALIQRVYELEQELMRFKTWGEEKKRYQLVSILSGTATVYALKESCKGTEPPHYICAKCYQDGHCTHLQPQYDKTGFAILFCPTCKAEIHSRYRHLGVPQYAKEDG
jgi:hypothetical protein